MAWIRSLYEKIKPYWPLAVIAMLGFIVFSNIVACTQPDDNARTAQRILDNQLESREHIRDVLSTVSEIETGVEGIEDNVNGLRELYSELGSAIPRIEESGLLVGDLGTEGGILADRLYRINRELAKRLEETTTE